MKNYGSVKDAPVDTDTKEVFKTVWELSMKHVINHGSSGTFICQSQSMNLFLAELRQQGEFDAFLRVEVEVKNGVLFAFAP